MLSRDVLRHNWPAITIGVTAVAIACAAIVRVRSMRPLWIVMATGPEGDAYYDVVKRYRAALARANVEVRLVPTTGSVENHALLLDPHSGVSVGLIEGGIGGAGDVSGLESLGTLFYEPLWWFHKREIRGVGVCAARRSRSGPKAVGRGRCRLSWPSVPVWSGRSVSGWPWRREWLAESSWRETSTWRL